jgi:hypothetical protein
VVAIPTSDAPSLCCRVSNCFLKSLRIVRAWPDLANAAKSGLPPSAEYRHLDADEPDEANILYPALRNQRDQGWPCAPHLARMI